MYVCSLKITDLKNTITTLKTTKTLKFKIVIFFLYSNILKVFFIKFFEK